jgi:hypothetical protein
LAHLLLRKLRGEVLEKVKSVLNRRWLRPVKS